jgi:predicted permease
VSALRRFVLRLRGWLLGQSDRRLREELEQHLTLQTADFIRNGLSPDEARRQARIKLGSLEAVREAYREEQRLPLLDMLVQDLRYTLRLLAKSRGFALTAIVTLALGIGVNTAMFTVIHGVLLKALPYPEPERLLRLVQTQLGDYVTIREFELVKAESRAFASVAAYRGGGERRIGPAEAPAWIDTVVASADFLRTLGIQPQIGREFTADETRPGGPAAILLSDGVWRQVFNADPLILGRAIAINDSSATVVGVLPADVWFPQPVDALLPLRPTGTLSDTGTNTGLIARLRPDVTLAQAQAELSGLTERLREQARESLPRQYRGLSAIEYRAWLVGDVRVNLLLLFGATGVLLLIACGNLALLLLSRFAARTREMAVRAALGSSRRRMLGQLLTENLLITTLGAAAGVFAAYALVQIFVSLSPFALPASGALRVNGTAVAFSLATALATAILVTVAPFLDTRRVNLPLALRSAARNAGGAMRARTRAAFVVGEVALSTTLLVAAALLVQTFVRTNQEQLGFDPRDVVTFETPLAPERARDAEARWTFTRTILERLSHAPGVRAAAAANVLPLTGQSNLPTQHDGFPDHSIGGMEVRSVTAGYFAAMGIRLAGGRALTEDDAIARAPVVVINETVARRWWPDGAAIGDRLTIGRFRGKALLNDVSREVVGIVADTKSVTVQAAPRPTVYVPMPAGFGGGSIGWIVKTGGQGEIAEQIRAAVREVDPAQRIARVRRMDDIVSAAAARPRFNASLFGAFAGIALVLTIVGLYGVLSFLVAQRRQEIGTRMALGASRGDVLRSVVRQGVVLTAAGLFGGLTAAVFLARWLSTLLFGVQPHDLASFGGVAAAVVLVGAAASYLPARRAASLDPLIAMRAE